MKRTVLVIESDPWLGDQYQRVIEQGGFAVVRASNPYTAIDIVDEKKPAAIVTSLLLSGSGALTLLHELQSYVDTAGIPVIVCSSLQQHLSLDDLKPYGVKRLVDSTSMKPHDLVAAVRGALS